MSQSSLLDVSFLYRQYLFVLRFRQSKDIGWSWENVLCRQVSVTQDHDRFWKFSKKISVLQNVCEWIFKSGKFCETLDEKSAKQVLRFQSSRSFWSVGAKITIELSMNFLSLKKMLCRILMLASMQYVQFHFKSKQNQNGWFVRHPNLSSMLMTKTLQRKVNTL